MKHRHEIYTLTMRDLYDGYFEVKSDDFPSFGSRLWEFDDFNAATRLDLGYFIHQQLKDGKVIPVAKPQEEIIELHKGENLGYIRIEMRFTE